MGDKNWNNYIFNVDLEGAGDPTITWGDKPILTKAQLKKIEHDDLWADIHRASKRNPGLKNLLTQVEAFYHLSRKK